MKQWWLRLWTSLLLLLAATPVVAQPARILLIRHGEKPESHDDPHLTATGRERAERWVGYFTNAPTRTPDVLFAPRPTKQHPSVRPVETLEPLAQALHLQIGTPFAAGDYARLAEQLLADPALKGKTVLVCWVHQSLPQFAAALGIQPEPALWKDDDYSGIYLITFEGGKAKLAATHPK